MIIMMMNRVNYTNETKLETRTEIKSEIKRETKTTATKETTIELNKKCPTAREKRQAHEHETPGVFFYLLPIHFISQNQSIISIT